MKQPDMRDMEYYYPSPTHTLQDNLEEDSSEEEQEWILNKTLREIDSKIQRDRDHFTKQGKKMALAAEEARAKYKKQQNGDIFNEIYEAEQPHIVDAYEHYTHHTSQHSNILRSNEIPLDKENEAIPNATTDLDKDIELDKADEEDMNLESQKAIDEEKLRVDYEKKLEELKSDYLGKMKEVEDKFEEKHMDL